ncbi:hypothetical protein MTR_8g047470 [Medicago truncatula]|uniref:Uncharacterized protein n=1 Tax=Medicago truncatula TaxID=3880 RepID=A0A072TQB6_MEDTR|nr:hypothetical protein MTR_8g047470 [Medicago truncatula]
MPCEYIYALYVEGLMPCEPICSIKFGALCPLEQCEGSILFIVVVYAVYLEKRGVTHEPCSRRMTSFCHALGAWHVDEIKPQVHGLTEVV